MTNKIPIKYIDYGLAFFVNDKKGNSWIEINKALNKNPSLKKSVLEHEYGHNTGKKMDIIYEIKDMLDLKKQWELTKFCIKNPSTFWAISPFVPGGINWFMLMLWSIIIFGLLVLSLIL